METCEVPFALTLIWITLLIVSALVGFVVGSGHTRNKFKDLEENMRDWLGEDE
jgi:hypothetical protein